MIIKSDKQFWGSVVCFIIGITIFALLVIFEMTDIPLWLKIIEYGLVIICYYICLLYTSPSPRD